MTPQLPSHVDVAIVGGGHNALTAAAYLAGAGLSVVVLERLAVWGGAAVSDYTFPGVDARLSRYSYLVSLLPQKIIDDLGLSITLAKRRYSSFTPQPGSDQGLLIDNLDAAVTQASFDQLGCPEDARAWRQFSRDTATLAEAFFPGVTDPLITRSEAKAALARRSGDDTLWERFIERPVGQTIGEYFQSDLVRGVALTDALIGTFADNTDPALDANRCFLYHVIGGGTGDWDVPVGGMGAVSGALAHAAREAGAMLLAECEVTAVEDGAVRFTSGSGHSQVAARYVLVGVSPAELARLTGAAAPSPAAEGAQVKVNMVLRRLPRLKDPRVTPEQAFGGTFHVNETWDCLHQAYQSALAGRIPDPLPCEIYCHSLTDPSIVSPELQAQGVHTLTVFALHVPHRLTHDRDPDDLRADLQRAVLSSLNAVLAEPIEPLLLPDGEGNPCIETKTTADLEDALRLPGGNIFHGPLEWPFVEDDAVLDTPEQRWGVSTGIPGVFFCGSGARRGGAVSGIGGHNAAMAVLEREAR